MPTALRLIVCDLRRAALFLGCLGAALASVEGGEIPPVKLIRNPSPAYQRSVEVGRRTHELMEARDMDGLEKLAGELRTSRERLDGGTWILSTYYEAIGHLPKDPAEADQRMAFFREWAKERPESITAQVSLAEALTSYAWKARGTGWADSVTEEGWRLMRERLDEAWKVLVEARNLEEKCPGWYESAQSVALGQGWGLAEYLQMVDEATAKEPTYGRYYTNACYYQLPRWHGETGDFEKWIAKKADAFPEDQRDRQYAFLTWMAERMPVRGEMVFGPGRLDWERTKRGFDEWVKEDPENLMVRFEYIRLALLADDRETVRQQFDVTGGKYWPRMWKDEEQFKTALAYAYDNGPNPDIGRSGRSRSSGSLDAETLEIVRWVARLGAGLCGGMLAGSLLLIIAARRHRAWAGFAALVVSVVLAIPFGTLATILPAAGLFLHLHRQKRAWPPELAPPGGWIVLLWVLVLSGAYLLLQVIAVIFPAIPLALEGGGKRDEVFEFLMRDGIALRISVSTAWIVLLGLFAIITPQPAAGLKSRLGLVTTPVLPALGWGFVAFAINAVLNLGSEQFMDERSREALKMMAEGLYSPFWFYLAIAFVGPTIEELLFRGYAFSGWINKLGFAGTALATSFIFMACHVQYGMAGLAYVFGLGLILSALRWKTNSVYPCIAVHILNNLAHCLLVQFWPDQL